jgi:hypothetical protein
MRKRPTKTDEINENPCTRFKNDLSAVAIFFVRFESHWLRDISVNPRASGLEVF